MKVDREEILSKLRKLKPEITGKFKAKELFLFGSFVNDTQHIKSDIDILVDFDEKADLIDMIGLSNALEDTFHLRVDIVPKNALRDEIRSSVLKSSIAI